MSVPANVAELVPLMRARGYDVSAPAGAEATDRPWFITLLQGLAGWLAGIFLLVFVGMVFKPDDTSTLVVLGVLLLGGAWFMYYADAGGAFLDQFALACSIAGQIAIVWAVVHDDTTALRFAGTVLVLQLVVVVAMPNDTARAIASLFAGIAWLHFIRAVLVPGSAERLLFNQGSGSAPVFGAGTPYLIWLLTWGLLSAKAAWLVALEPRWMATGLRKLARPGLTGLLLTLALGGLASDPLGFLFLPPELLGIRITASAIFPLLTIAIALFAAWCAFRLRSRGLLGFALLCAVVHVARFYYLFGTTLLAKSAIMLCVGAALLGAGVLLRRQWERTA